MATDNLPTDERGGPPESFVKMVKDALEHLYDFPHLQGHPLARQRGRAQADSTEAAGHHLRRELVSAIESLNPGPGVPFRTLSARRYNLLALHYVEGMTVREAGQELAISLRQAYRDLRRAQESVAAVLWARQPGENTQEPNGKQVTSIQAEIARLETNHRPTDVRSLLQDAVQAVARLASQRSVTLRVEVPPEPVIVSTDRTVARQVLVSALSHAIQVAEKGTLDIVLAVQNRQTPPALTYVTELVDNSPMIDGVVAQLVDQLGWTVAQEDRPPSARVVTLSMRPRGPIALVIDDNKGLVELLDRYLAGEACRVVAATNGTDGFRLARELAPDAIILDVMMPEMDGWETLQKLRAHPRTVSIPVILCSVINDPKLAYSLGASLLLPKPVSRDEILGALRELGLV